MADRISLSHYFAGGKYCVLTLHTGQIANHPRKARRTWDLSANIHSSPCHFVGASIDQP